MNYAEWMTQVPSHITNDPIWKLEVYRLALFAGDIGLQDAPSLMKKLLMLSVADQLHRSMDSISANLTEGYSRSKGLDRARFLEIALGSARESRDWYYKSRHVLSTEVIKHRMDLLTHIISMLTPMISHQRKNALREEQAPYDISSFVLEADTLSHNPSFLFLLSSLARFHVQHKSTLLPPSLPLPTRRRLDGYDQSLVRA